MRNPNNPGRGWDDKIIERLCHYLMSRPAYVQQFTLNHHSVEDGFDYRQSQASLDMTTIDIKIVMPSTEFRRSQKDDTPPQRQIPGSPMLPSSGEIIDGEFV